MVWITGASAGIGEVPVYEMVAAGARLVISACRALELERVADVAKAFGVADVFG